MKRNRDAVKVQNPGDTVVAIMHGSNSINVFKEQLMTYVYTYANELCDITKMGTDKKSYLNAFEWLIANLFRTAGIQLYEDGEIRLNLSPPKIVNGKKCLFLLKDDIQNREIDRDLYMVLFDLIYGKTSVKWVN